MTTTQALRLLAQHSIEARILDGQLQAVEVVSMPDRSIRETWVNLDLDGRTIMDWLGY